MQIALALLTLASTLAAPPPATSGLFGVVVRTGPSWDPAKAAPAQLHFKEHSANIRRLGAEGKLALGGRFGDMGLLIVRAGSEAEARALFDADPSIAAGTFRLEVHEWRTFAPGSVEMPPVAAPAGDAARGLTAVGGIKVGHFTLTERPTGCTAILTEAGATAGVDVRGGAPGTRETDLLQPPNTVQQVHAIVLSGGSAFGLDAATGVVRYLEEKGVGFDVGVAKVPIVPAAILFDLAVGGKPSVRPTADCGYRAAQAANGGPVAEGNVGAGAGATVGKSAGPDRAMKAGIGTASITTADGLVVAALVAVNAVGDIVDPATGRVVAGVRSADGKSLADARAMVRAGELGARRPPAPAAPRPAESTTIGVVATNAVLTKAQAQKVAQMAHDGIARAISPAHTPFDGDTLFALATGTRPGEANVGLIGALAAEVVADAILRAASQATGLAGYPAARDLEAAPAKNE